MVAQEGKHDINRDTAHHCCHSRPLPQLRSPRAKMHSNPSMFPSCNSRPFGLTAIPRCLLVQLTQHATIQAVMSDEIETCCSKAELKRYILGNQNNTNERANVPFLSHRGSCNQISMIRSQLAKVHDHDIKKFVLSGEEEKLSSVLDAFRVKRSNNKVFEERAAKSNIVVNIVTTQSTAHNSSTLVTIHAPEISARVTLPVMLRRSMVLPLFNTKYRKASDDQRLEEPEHGRPTFPRQAH